MTSPRQVPVLLVSPTAQALSGRMSTCPSSQQSDLSLTVTLTPTYRREPGLETCTYVAWSRGRGCTTGLRGAHVLQVATFS